VKLGLPQPKSTPSTLVLGGLALLGLEGLACGAAAWRSKK